MRTVGLSLSVLDVLILWAKQATFFIHGFKNILNSWKLFVFAQVSHLEQQLERANASLQDEVRSRFQEAQGRDEELLEMKKKNSQLSENVT